MTWSLSHAAQPAGLTAPATPESRALMAALSRVGGHARLLIYDLPHTEAPRRLPGTLIGIQGGARWQAYLRQRRRLDDGGLTLLLTLRRLGDEERLLVVDWGSAHANAFLLVEPCAPEIDLSDPGGACVSELRAALASPDRLDRLLRALYGAYIYWRDAPARADTFRGMPLVAGDGRTLAQELEAALGRAFPPLCFDGPLGRLLREESELFLGRSVERARSPFLTRLGLPVAYHPSLVTGAMRRLVNAGAAALRAPDGAIRFHGPALPIPDDVPDELVERLLL